MSEEDGKDRNRGNEQADKLLDDLRMTRDNLKLNTNNIMSEKRDSGNKDTDRDDDVKEYALNPEILREAEKNEVPAPAAPTTAKESSEKIVGVKEGGLLSGDVITEKSESQSKKPGSSIESSPDTSKSKPLAPEQNQEQQLTS